MFGTMKASIGDWNERSGLPIRAGLVAGLMGTATILVLVTALMIRMNTDVWTAAHDTLSALAGVNYTPDTFQILAGSLVHLVISAVLGAAFTSLPCCFPRGFWMVAGLIYGMGTGFIACFFVQPILMMVGIHGTVNFFLVMWFNVLYGFLYGLAAATYGLEVPFASRIRRIVSRSSAAQQA